MFSLLVCAALQACASPESGKLLCPAVPVYEEPAYETAQCTRMTIRDTRTIRFSYCAAREETLYFSEEGLHYSAFFVSPGSVVQEGELLCELDPEDYPRLLSEAEASMADLEAEEALLEAGWDLTVRRESIGEAGSPEQERERQNALKEGKLRYEQKKTELEDRMHILGERMEEYREKIRSRQLFAPFEGTVTYVYSPGASDLSEKTRGVVTVTDQSRMLFTADTEYREYFHSGEEYVLTVDGEDRLALAVPADGGEEDTVCLALQVPDYDLEDGITGTVELSLEERENVLGIPKRALASVNGRPAVYVYGENGFRTYREVETGMEGLSYVEIISGLEEGEEVLLPD